MENHKRSWFSGMKAEFKKISWPTKNDLTKQTIAVVVSSVVVGSFVSLMDYVIRFGVEYLVSFPK